MAAHSESASSASGEGEWLDIDSGDDEETVLFVSLLDKQTFPTASAMLAHVKQAHGFDLIACVQRLKLDFHGAVQLVNFIRDRANQGLALPQEISNTDFEDERFLRPVLENDALLFSLDEILEESQQLQADDSTDTKALTSRNRELEEELEQVRNQFANYRLAVQETLDKRWGDDTEPAPVNVPKQDSSAYYFESYAQHEIHETMLKDAVRTDAYRDFIYENKHIFKDKVVLDIGCGTGILSMFCAKAGAKRVIAVDKSDIITKATENIFNNGLTDIITCVKGAIEEVKLPVDQVDVIVSEWMGYCLLYEAMLPSVLFARDKYLKPDGILAPSSCSIWMAPVADPEHVAEHIAYWRDVYGFDMKAMQEAIYDDVRIEVMPQAAVCGTPSPFKVLDLYTIQPSDLQFTASWKSTLNRDIDGLDGFLIWFDNFFGPSRNDPVPPAETTPDSFNAKRAGNVAFTTGPFHTATHWKQGLLLAPPDGPRSKLTTSTSFSGEITFAADKDNARALRLDVSWAPSDGKSRNYSWRLK